MAGKSKDSMANRIYDIIQPLTSWKRAEQSDVVDINLPGFEKQRLKILLDSTGKMKISGERPESGNKWQRFSVDLLVDQACDINAICAKYDKGILTVTMPKTILGATISSPKMTQDAEPAGTSAKITRDAEPAGTLACEYRPESWKRVRVVGSFFDELNTPTKVAMGMMLGAAAVLAGIYAISKFKILRSKTGE